MKKYRANYGTEIEEIEVIKETEKQIVYISRDGTSVIREAKISDWASWHNTKEDAVNFLIAKEQKKIDEKLMQIEYHKANMDRIYKL